MFIFQCQNQFGLLTELCLRNVRAYIAIVAYLPHLRIDLLFVAKNIGIGEDFAHVLGFYGDAVGLQQLFAIAYGAERHHTRTDLGDAGGAHRLHDGAYLGEAVHIRVKFLAVYRASVPRRERVFDAVLIHVVAQTQLAAEGIPTIF